MKYEIDVHLFSKKLSSLLIKKEMIDKKGEPDKIALYNLLYPKNAINDEDCKIDRQAVTDKTRNISNWLKGNNYPKRISDVLDLCNALDCDLDYFFTNMPAPTHDIEFISKETNLSCDAILYIQNATEYEQLILDTILKKEYFWDICYAIYSYMQTYYKEFQIQDANTGNVNLQDKEKMEFAEYRATKHFSNTLINKISKDEDIKKYNKYEHDLEILRHTLSSDSFRKNLEMAVEAWKKSGMDFNEYIEYIEEKKTKRSKNETT